MNTTETLQPSTVEELKNKCSLLEQQNAELTAKIRWFEEQFRLQKHSQLGASSERTLAEQQELFNEEKTETQPTLPEPLLKGLPTVAGSSMDTGTRNRPLNIHVQLLLI
jgi:transposase